MKNLIIIMTYRDITLSCVGNRLFSNDTDTYTVYGTVLLFLR